MFKMTWNPPKSHSDKAALTFLTVIIPAVLLFEVLVVLPRVAEDEGGKTFMYKIHLLSAMFLSTNIIGNLYYLLTRDIGSSSIVLPSILKDGWKFCSACECNSPPRSHHCHECDTCVLRRDHHCVFAGRCIGHANYRYYLMFLFHLWLSTAYCNILNWNYIEDTMGEMNGKTLVVMFLPILGWMLGFCHGITFVKAFVCAICLIGFLFISTLLGFHAVTTSRGQTTHERNQNVRLYDLGFKRNVLQVLGSRFWLVWLSPWLPSPLPSNGLEFEQRTFLVLENSKSL